MNEINPATLFIPEIRVDLERKDIEGLRTVLLELNPIDLADVFDQFTPDQQLLIFRLLDPRRQMIVFEELDVLQQEYLIHHLNENHLMNLLEGLPARVTQQLLRKLPTRSVRRMELHMRQGQAETPTKAMPQFPPNSVGALMEPNPVSLRPDMTASGALAYIRSRLKVRHTQVLQTVFVINNRETPVGALTLRSLIAAPVDTRISELMIPAALIRMPATMDGEEASKIFSHYKLLTAPVVDAEDRLIGTLSAGEILRVIQEEATEDILKLSAVENLDEPYFKVSFTKMLQKRGSWLSVLFIGEMLTATAMGYFEKEIARAVVLALFVPLIISSGGNSGSQAATLVVRAMALREITFKDWWRVMRREFAMGISLGSLLGVVGFLRIFLWSQFTDIYGPHYLLIAFTVGTSLVLVVLWGSLAGSLLPIFLRKVGLDPAVVSAPFVATLVDVTGLIIYFMTGLFILKGTLL